ncbi:hypothetical protein DL764_010259 [Monosporascus ibericus]|uniref:Copper transport protein n=1 Tax=Monosporascus ibericus TaxID=155417 RepID=A0A4Q4ST34_9PEZI|nr:hypothetical protein DL764_010259 [Monosporascus ibericus]
MDHSHMDHGGHGGHGDMDMGGDMCNMNMLFTWDTTNLCIVFRQWHVRGPASLVVSLMAIVAICAGYEALREATRRYEARTDKQEEATGPRRKNQGEASKRRRLIKSVLYGVQNFYAFMIMLLFMTYNGWVMIAVAVGAGIGYYVFGSHTKATKETACH